MDEALFWKAATWWNRIHQQADKHCLWWNGPWLVPRYWSAQNKFGDWVGLYPWQEWMKTLSQFLENTLPTARKQELWLSPERAASCLYSGILLLWLFNNSTDPSQEKIRGTLANRIRVEATTMWSQRVNHFVFERTAATVVLSSSLVCVMALPVESFLNRVFITVPCSLTLSHSLTMSPADTKCSTSRSAITCNLHNSNKDKSQKQENSAQ